MKTKTITIRVLASALAALVLVLGTVVTGAAGPSPQTPAKGGGGIRTATHPETGKLSFIGAEPGAPIAVRGAVGQGFAPAARARAVLAAYAPQFGVADPQRDLALTKETSEGSRQVVRYRQEFQGIPVLGGELTLNMNDGGLISMNGEISPDLSVSTEPAISGEQAQQRAIAAVAKYYGLDASALTASEPQLWIYDPRLLVGRSPIPPHLVWRMDVTAAGRPIRELVLIDALRGGVSLSFNQIDTFWGEQAAQRSGQAAKAAPPASVQPAPPAALGTPLLETRNLNGTEPYPYVPPSSGTQECLNNVRACGSSDSDANNAHAFAYDTYMTYANRHSRDSIDNAGMKILSMVNYGVGYQNAFWDSEKMVYGDNMAADDVVGHELTHGVTENESGLFYYFESGAINESLSDIWGEYVDQTNSGSTRDGPTWDWKLGEDTAAAGLGVIRDLKNPPAYGQPDSMTSARYYKGGGDNGGVHYNSGVNNKAAYLMVAGGSFNGKVVTPLGWEKTLAVYYEAQTNLLTSGSGYYDLYYALYQACLNKVGGAEGITLADCQEVRDATDATKMNLEPGLGFNPNATACPTGMSVYNNLFTEDFETAADGWTFGGVKPANWSLWSASPWYSYVGPNAKDGVESLYGDDDDGYFNDYTNNDTWAISPNIVLPPNSKPYLFFSHWFGFEYYSAYNFDGGVLEYSTDGGATWTDAKPLFSGGQNYKGNIYSYSGNPLGGRNAFVNASHGYVDSRYNLTSLAGQTVNFRWRMGTDVSGAYWGWFLDAIQVNTCLGIPSIPTLQSPANNLLVTNPRPFLNWSDSTGDVVEYEYQLSLLPDFSVLYHAGNTPISEFTFWFDIAPNAKYYWRVRSVNAAGGASAWTAALYFRSAMLPPNSVSPGNVYPPGPEEQLLTRRPVFDWDAVAGAASYTLEVSTAPTFATKAINKVVYAPASEYTHTTDLLANTIYYWRVKANGTNGPSLYSQVRQFRTGNPPSIPTLSAPANNALLSTLTPTLKWNKSTVPAGTTFRWYELQIDTSNAFGSPVIEFTDEFDLNDVEFVTDPLLEGTTYFWRVRSYNTAGEYSGWSAVRSFRIPYAGPALNLPLDTATGVSRKPTFEWNVIPGAASYTLQVSTSPAFSLLAVNKTIYAPAVSYTHTTNLLANTLYYWRVRANGAYGPGFWSSVYTFTTGP